MATSNPMLVKKRNGVFEEVSFDKITTRIRKLCEMEPRLKEINYILIAQKVITRIYDGITTTELDELAARICAQKITEHQDYGRLASRITISNNHKTTPTDYKTVVETLWANKDNVNKQSPLVSEALRNLVLNERYVTLINDAIDYQRDYDIDYFGYSTLEKGYLLKSNRQVIERPQHMFMRVALGIHVPPDYGQSGAYYSDDDMAVHLNRAIVTYDLMSRRLFTHATPTLYQAGTPHPQLLSCFLLGVEDSVDGIYRKALADCAEISKWAGGIGAWMTNVRGTDALIRGTNGRSNGLMPMLRVFNETSCHINQGGKRQGSFAIYLEPWHTDVLTFLDAKKNRGAEKMRARDLFYALWVPDLFMERVASGGQWSLMDPDRCRGLSDAYGDEFRRLYEAYEQNPDCVVKQMPAQKLWAAVMDSQIETGTPYICYKDAVNKKTNQQNVGTIHSSNLCSEIMEYSSSEEYACCTLASISLPGFVKTYNMAALSGQVTIYSKPDCIYCLYTKRFLDSYGIQYRVVTYEKPEERQALYELIEEEHGHKVASMPQIFVGKTHVGGFTDFLEFTRPRFDYEALIRISGVITRNLDRVIDINYYPVEKTRLSNMRHRPLGIGVQGLADVYAQFHCGFDSELAAELNRNIFAAIYYGACLESNQLATEHGAYSTFAGSPMSRGEFQFDMWGATPVTTIDSLATKPVQLDWTGLRERIRKDGVRNSLLLAMMPTGSTAQILGNNECIEPFTSTIYSRRTLAGNFQIVNRYLQDLLYRIGVWDVALKDRILLNDGSVQGLKEVPAYIQAIYKTAWDLSMKAVINQSADRGVYVCQSQSLNIWLSKPDIASLSSMHFYGWRKGLKTGMYYLRTRAQASAQQFTIEPEKAKKEEEDEGCVMCSA
jgi:ribonucleoside-diphosphate reductase alpha subunit